MSEASSLEGLWEQDHKNVALYKVLQPISITHAMLQSSAKGSDGFESSFWLLCRTWPCATASDAHVLLSSKPLSA